ncbi:MAG: metal ABC transporter solute-binding protein, Zn/Mn family, partial [Phycisphaerales bacterium]
MSRAFAPAFLAAMLLAVMALAGTTLRVVPAPAPDDGAAVRVVATTTQCADLARQVCAGIPDFEVEGLMHAGVDPHLWRPTVSDVRKLASADAVVCNGLMLEGRVSHVTVVKTVDRLVAGGLVRKEPYGPATLTPPGMRLARAARVRHERVLAFLRSIGVPEPVARRDAEGLEHHVSPETISAMVRC